MTELTSEDALRLNVLVANSEAIRINENTMEVFGLQGEKELRAELHPNDRSDRYLKTVREMLSGVVLDSPGGYPVFLRRWTRMGQIDGHQLDRLLMLGEPEAVMAVVCSPGLTDELARLAWWCAPYAEYARRMLENPRVVNGKMGPLFAEFLIEHLPFETEHNEMLDTVRLVLQPGLINEKSRQRLWDSGRSRKSYRVGFLTTQPDQLLDPAPPRYDLADHRTSLQRLIAENNPYAALLLKLLDSTGQTFALTALDAMRRPADQEVVAALFNAVGNYLGEVRHHPQPLRDHGEIGSLIAALKQTDPALQSLLGELSVLAQEIDAMLRLAHTDEALLIPIFAMTDAVGSVMRKKILPVTTPLLEDLECLQGLRRAN